MANFKSKSIDRLFEAFLNLESVDECYEFFEDLCTINEIKDMAQRLEAAELLEDGVNYITITKKLGISTATISRVSKCLNYGTGGYKKAISKLPKSEEQDV